MAVCADGHLKIFIQCSQKKKSKEQGMNSAKHIADEDEFSTLMN